MNDLERLRRLQGRLERLNRKRVQALKDLKNLELLYERTKEQAQQLAKRVQAS